MVHVREAGQLYFTVNNKNKQIFSLFVCVCVCVFLCVGFFMKKKNFQPQTYR